MAALGLISGGVPLVLALDKHIDALFDMFARHRYARLRAKRRPRKPLLLVRRVQRAAEYRVRRAHAPLQHHARAQRDAHCSARRRSRALCCAREPSASRRSAARKLPPASATLL